MSVLPRIAGLGIDALIAEEFAVFIVVIQQSPRFDDTFRFFRSEFLVDGLFDLSRERAWVGWCSGWESGGLAKVLLDC